MFYKVLQFSILEFSSKFYNIFGKFNIRESYILLFFLLDCSIYIIEQYTNLKYIKHQEKQLTFKKRIRLRD